jgi:hypothetical protein
MALQLSSGRVPAVTGDELAAFRQQLTQIGSGFESALLDYPDLVGADGRQDFLHFFLYPLVVAPAVPVVAFFGLHPNWAFTIVNAILLSGAMFVVASRYPLVAAVAGFVGPIIWWVDKAHTEAFLFATLSVAAAAWRDRPAWALVIYALAGAQNAALGLTYPIFAAVVWKGSAARSLNRQVWLAAAAGAAIVASPFLYTWMRLGRYSVMADYAQRAVPSFGGLAAFVIEPNIGLLPNAPAYGIALLAAGWLLARQFRRVQIDTAVWWWPALIQLALLLLWSQNPNANHGGTPGVNRWTLSLLAISVPWIADARRSLGHGARITLNMLVAVTGLLSAAAHLPSQPENYREPTVLAMQLWDRGWVHITPAEVFAERTQGREPAVVPSHDGSCRVLLIADQQAPAQCRPPTEPLPSWCRQPSALCYAVADGLGARYVRAPMNGFFFRFADRSWPAGGPLAAGIHRVLREADPQARVWRLDNPRRWRERLGSAEIGVVLATPDVTVIHVLRVAESARQVLAADQDLRIVPLITRADAGNAEMWTNLAVIVKRDGGR